MIVHDRIRLIVLLYGKWPSLRRARALEARSRRFESCLPDKETESTAEWSATRFEPVGAVKRGRSIRLFSASE